MCEDRRWKLFPNEDLASKVVFFYWRHPWLGEWSLNSMKPTSVDISKAPPSDNSKNETLKMLKKLNPQVFLLNYLL